MGFFCHPASLPIRRNSTCDVPSWASTPCLGVFGEGGCEWVSWFSWDVALRSRSKCSRIDSSGDTGVAVLGESSLPCFPGKEADERNSGNEVALSNGDTRVPGEDDSSRPDGDGRGCRVRAVSKGEIKFPGDSWPRLASITALQHNTA